MDGTGEAWLGNVILDAVHPPDAAGYRLTGDVDEDLGVFFDASGRTYGSPRITLDLWAAGYQASENTVAKLMAQLGLAGRKPRRRPTHLTRQGKRPAAPDLVRRKFSAVAPNVLWCGDLTEVDADEGKLYLATVLDLFSRRLLGYAMFEHHDAALAKASLQMAVATGGDVDVDVDGVIFHSDRGSEYTGEKPAKKMAYIAGLPKPHGCV